VGRGVPLPTGGEVWGGGCAVLCYNRPYASYM